MSIGLLEAVRRAGRVLQVPLALDSDEAVVELYRKNLPGARVEAADVTTYFDGAPGADVTDAEAAVKEKIGQIDILMGGPPCQGHSDLNNHTRRRDPKNALYLRMARAAEILAPTVVVVENVAPVQWDRGGVVTETTAALQASGYQVAGDILDLSRLGVPQRRRRYVLLASKRSAAFAPRKELERLVGAFSDHPARSVGWAIADLRKLQSDSLYDTPSVPTVENAQRMLYLFAEGLYDLPNAQRPTCHRDKEHSYVSMYGRLRWNQPAQTITTGFGSMGQGRYVHPSQPRTITPHEAARLQTFPDWFDFGEDTPRGVLAKAIGNAVPPLLMVLLGQRIVRALGSTAKPGRHPA